MKENRVSDSGGLKGSALNGRSTKVLRAIAYKGIRAALVALAAAMALVLLTGCASVPVPGDSGPWNYDPDNGRWSR